MTGPDADRIAGCLLGGMIGDAVGAAYEGRGPGSFVVPQHLAITDDTQLTLATCEAILEERGVSAKGIGRHFARWFRGRRLTGLGAATLKALIELEAGGHWGLSGLSGERAAGNGAAMRIAPLAFFLDPDDEAGRRTIRDVAHLTHRHDEAYLGALAIVRALRAALSGAPLGRGLFETIIAALPDSQVRDRLLSLRDDGVTLDSYSTRFTSTGSVVDTVPLALLAAAESSDFLDTVGRLVGLGGDTDTVCSLLGQLYGAACGTAALPLDLADRIDEAAEVRRIAGELSRLLAELNGGARGE